MKAKIGDYISAGDKYGGKWQYCHVVKVYYPVNGDSGSYMVINESGAKGLLYDSESKLVPSRNQVSITPKTNAEWLSYIHDLYDKLGFRNSDFRKSCDYVLIELLLEMNLVAEETDELNIYMNEMQWVEEDRADHEQELRKFITWMKNRETYS